MCAKEVFWDFGTRESIQTVGREGRKEGGDGRTDVISWSVVEAEKPIKRPPRHNLQQSKGNQSLEQWFV